MSYTEFRLADIVEELRHLNKTLDKFLELKMKEGAPEDIMAKAMITTEHRKKQERMDSLDELMGSAGVGKPCWTPEELAKSHQPTS